MNGKPGRTTIDSMIFDFSADRFFLRLAYLFLSFPLGVFYFVLLSVGIALGLGLAIIWVGIPILVVVLAAWLALTEFERRQANSMLGAEIPVGARSAASQKGFWGTLKFQLADSATWKGLVFLLLKFPLGIVGFVLTLSLAVTSVALMAVPFVYEFVPVRFGFGYVTSWEEALLCALCGILLAGGTVLLVNGLALFWNRAASHLLTREPPDDSVVNPESGQVPVMIP